MTSMDEVYKPIKARLQAAGVTRAVVADNLFGTPSIEDIAEDIEDFWNYVERDQNLLKALEARDIGTSSSFDIDEKAISKLWCGRNDGSVLSKVAKQKLFLTVLRDLDGLLTIVESLESLGLEVIRIGNELELDEELAPASLVFLDYYWGAVTSADSPKRAGVIAREVYDRHAAAQEKPFIILMSSRPEVKSLAEEFRKDSDLLGGLFDFVLREELQDQSILTFKLGIWASGMTTRHKIQDFVETLGDSILPTTQAFVQKVRSLTIEDYVYAQALSLKEEGHPLGDYLLWLFGSLLINMFLEDNEELRSKKRTVDELSFDSFVPSQSAPSRYLSEMYGLAITEPSIGGIEPHPRDDGTDPKKRLPFLRFGDLLVRNADSAVYMIATPDCDLAFAPDSKRQLDPCLSVILIPGRLIPIWQREEHSALRTELFHHKGGQYRIHWKPKRVTSVPIGQFRKWCSDNQCFRVARMRTQYALEMQQELTSDVGRVGIPTVPPLFEQIDVQLYCEGPGAAWTTLGESVASGATVVHTRDEKAYVLISAEYVGTLQRQMTSVIDILKQKQENMKRDNPAGAARYTPKIERLNAFQQDPEQLLALVEKEWNLPAFNKTTMMAPNAIGLHRNGDFTQGCQAAHLICLDIIYD